MKKRRKKSPLEMREMRKKSGTKDEESVRAAAAGGTDRFFVPIWGGF